MMNWIFFIAAPRVEKQKRNSHSDTHRIASDFGEPIYHSANSAQIYLRNEN